MSGLTFGVKSKDYVPPTIDPDDVWIKGIMVGDHKVRFLEPTEEWVTYREHYDVSRRRYFPCTEDTQTCPGCTSDAERTRSRQRRYAFNALNDRGLLNVYKVGKEFRDRLAKREQRVGSLMDRDYLLIREGKGKDDTTYDYEGQDISDCPFDGELFDIREALKNQYMQYLELLAGNETAGDTADDAAHEEPVKAEEPKKAAARTRTAKKDEGDEAQTAPAAAEPQAGSGDPSTGVEKDKNSANAFEDGLTVDQVDEILDDWTLRQMKDYLEERDIEYPARAGRPALAPLVKQSYFGF